MRKTTFAAIAAGALILAGLRDGPTQAIARWRLRLLPRLKAKSIRSALCRPQRICPRRSLRTSRLCFRRRRQNQSTHENEGSKLTSPERADARLGTIRCLAPQSKAKKLELKEP